MVDDNVLDLALIMCPAWGAEQPPIGISYLKGFLKGHGIGVKCFDLSLELYKVFPEKKYWDLNYPESFIVPELFDKNILPMLKPHIDKWAENILSYNPAAAGFSLFMSSINVSLILARRLKEIRRELIIIGGGPEVTRARRVLADGIGGFASLNKGIITHDCFDILIDGEGEETLLEILLLNKQSCSFHNIEGILYKDNGRIVVNKPRALISDLNILPSADYSDYQLDNYTKKSLPLVTSRGCINRCTFCADSPLWKTYRYRSPKEVMKEIDTLLNQYKINVFEMADSTFNGNTGRVEQICDLIIASGLNIKWSAKVSFGKGMSYELLRKLRMAGCLSLSYGLESGSPEVLRDMRKNDDLIEAKRIIKDTWRAGIHANCFFIIGYPTETEEDFQMTLNFVRENYKFIYCFDQVTGCHIEEDSYLGLNLGKYGIVFKSDGWHNGVSTPQIRKERLARFRELARRLHKHYQCEVQS